MEAKIKKISPDLPIRGNQNKGQLSPAANPTITQKAIKKIDRPPGREEAGRANFTFTPLDNMGVETGKTLEFGIDYLEFTLYTGKLEGLEIYAQIFMDYLGELNLEGNARFYDERYTNGQGFAYLCKPKNKTQKNHIRFEMPGAICQALPIEALKKLYKTAGDRGIILKCRRIDIRIDYCPFEPIQIYNSILKGDAITRAQRSTLKYIDSPNDQKEDGTIGSHTTYLGSRESGRYLRIYDKHGFTRLELECKNDFAYAYFNLLQDADDKFCDIAFGLILDFIDIDADYWEKFKNGYQRAYMKVTEYNDPTLENLEKYLLTQAIVPLAILWEIKGEKWLKNALEGQIIRALNNPKYSMLLHAHGIFREDYE